MYLRVTLETSGTAHRFAILLLAPGGVGAAYYQVVTLRDFARAR